MPATLKRKNESDQSNPKGAKRQKLENPPTPANNRNEISHSALDTIDDIDLRTHDAFIIREWTAKELNKELQPSSQVPKKFTLNKKKIKVGRDPSCDLTLNSSRGQKIQLMISRNHAFFERRDNAYYLCDNGSTNGVMVNDKLLAKKNAYQRLCTGDIILFGKKSENTEFYYKYCLMPKPGYSSNNNNNKVKRQSTDSNMFLYDGPSQESNGSNGNNNKKSSNDSENEEEDIDITDSKQKLNFSGNNSNNNNKRKDKRLSNVSNAPNSDNNNNNNNNNDNNMSGEAVASLAAQMAAKMAEKMQVQMEAQMAARMEQLTNTMSAKIEAKDLALQDANKKLFEKEHENLQRQRDENEKELARQREISEREKKELEEEKERLNNKTKELESKEKEIELAKQEKEELEEQIALKKAKIEEESKRLAEQTKKQSEMSEHAKAEMKLAQEKQAEALKNLEEMQALKNEMDEKENENKKRLEEINKDKKNLEDKLQQEKEQIEARRDEMEEQFTCAICQDLMYKVQVLNCGHSCCEQCVDDWIVERTPSGNADCPHCRQKISSRTPCIMVDSMIEEWVKKAGNEEHKEDYDGKKREYKIWKDAKLAKEIAKQEEEKRKKKKGGRSSQSSRRHGAGGRNNNNNNNNNNRRRRVDMDLTQSSSEEESSSSDESSESESESDEENRRCEGYTQQGVRCRITGGQYFSSRVRSIRDAASRLYEGHSYCGFHQDQDTGRRRRRRS